MKKHIILLLILIVNSLLPIQARIIQKIKMEQGLSSNYVTGIAQDKQGIMWFTTISGLNRFDGNRFKVFSKSGRNSLNGNGLNVVFSDLNNNMIWIGNSRTGLNSFNCLTSQFTSYRNNPKDKSSICNDGITDITNGTDANLWIATYSGGVDRLNKNTRKFEHFDKSTVKGLVSNMCWNICDDHQGNLYVAHVMDGMSIINIKDKIARNYRNNPNDPTSIPDNNVFVVYKDSYNNIWVGTKNGLALFNPIDETFIVFRSIPGNKNSLSSNIIKCIDESNDKKLFIGTVNGGVNILDLKQFFFTKSLSKVTFEHIKAGYEVDQLSHANINSIFHDSYDNVWIATDGGINFYANNNLPFQSYNYNPVINNMNSLSHPVVSGLTIDKNSALWVATYGGGIDVFRNNTKINNYNHSNNVVTDLIISTFADSENNIWFGAYGGKIYRYSLKNKSFNNMSALFKCKSTEVNCFFEDKFKRIYIGTNNGLYIYNYSGNHIEWKLVHNSDNVANMVHALSQDIYGNIWVGTLKGQITIFDKSFRKIRSIGTNSTACINQFYYDSKKRMWVATGENLLMFSSWKNQECDTFDIKQELKNSSVNSITEDSHGQIWLGTNSGICCLNPENKSYVNYDHFDGIPMGDFRVGAVAKSDDGVIYLGSDNGVCYFKPDEIAKRRTFPTASITDFKVIGNMNSLQNQEALYSTINPIQLRYNQNTFTVFFNVLDYSYNNRIEFSYMLEGFENVWYDVQNSKQVTFQNLPPGNYTFHLRSRYKNQQWIDATSNLSISISPPFWLAWWAKVLYTIIVLYTGFYFIRLYKRRLQLENSLYLEKQHSLQQQNLNDERFRFFTNITHELRTPLTLIIGPLEDFVNDMNLHENYKKKITMIYKNASRLLDLVNQILEFRKTETQNRKLCVLQSDLSNQIHEIALKYKELNRNQNVRIQCVVEEGNFELVYDPEVIMIILDNLISNALKYTKKGSVSIGLRNLNVDNGNYIEIEIKDTGCGIEPKTLPHIFDRYFQADSEFQAAGSGIGLAIVKSLVKLHEAEIYVESKLNEGTMFRVRLARTGLYSEASHLQENEPYATESFETKPILLIVEDNQDIQAYITDVFSDSFHVITANNGQEGLEIAIAKSPDIIISDIMMPVMDGIEFCSKIKDDVQTSHISFILLTAKDSIRDKTTGYSVGADSYITKPFSADLLKSRVSNLLESRKKMAASFANSILTKSELTNESMNRLDKEFIIKLTSFVEENIEHEEINIATLTDVVFMSRSTLYRKIKTLTGLSINKFVLKIKMRKAEELIVTGQYTLTEIMSMVGISSSSYFRKCFKDEFNVNPSDYAKKLK